MTGQIAYIGLGSNLGDRSSCINKALEMLAESGTIEVTAVSEFIETSALARIDQPDYINAVAKLKTSLSAEALLKKMMKIETSLGRVRKGKFSPRTIDLDLLLFGEQIIKTPDLTVPHPQMHLRSFVLGPLSQLAGGLIHPVIKESVATLAARLGGCDFVLKPDSFQLVSIAGIIGVGKTTLTKNLAKFFGVEQILEPYDSNPFMQAVYAGKKELALDSQLYFLIYRSAQLSCDLLACGRAAVSDYVFDKELIYAKRLLSPIQLGVYEQIYPLFAAKTIEPTLVIYMTDSAENCLGRIHQRSRPYEQKIERQFLESLSRDYDRLFADWKSCPVIRLTTPNFDCTKKGDIENLADQLRSYVAV